MNELPPFQLKTIIIIIIGLLLAGLFVWTKNASLLTKPRGFNLQLPLLAATTS